MIFVDYLGPAEHLARVRTVVRRRVAEALRVRSDDVIVRRIVSEGGTADIELWVELSSDEQLYRLGKRLAQSLAEELQDGTDGPQVWVMYRVVPLTHAFLNGEQRGRGLSTLD